MQCLNTVYYMIFVSVVFPEICLKSQILVMAGKE
jgi:hypothetical protein